MARTYHHRPLALQTQERPWLKGWKIGGRGRPALQRAAHKQDRAALKLALRTGAEPPLPQRSRVDWDQH